MRNNSKLDNSLSLTVDIFENVQADRYCYKGYELIWSIYDVVHMYYSIPYYLNCGDLNVLRWEDDNKKFVKKYISLIKKIFQDLFLLLYSVISIAIVGLFKRGAVAIWTGDFYDLNKRGDFRVGNLYIELESNNINYIEFIRDDAEGFVHALKNIIKRRRVAVYYNSIERIFGWKYRNDHQTVHLKHNDKLHIDILSQAISFIAKPYKIEITRKIFRFMRVKSFI